jgi:hypothetical protein
MINAFAMKTSNDANLFGKKLRVAILTNASRLRLLFFLQTPFDIVIEVLDALKLFDVFGLFRVSRSYARIAATQQYNPSSTQSIRTTAFFAWFGE